MCVTAFLVGMMSSVWHDLAMCKRQISENRQQLAVFQSNFAQANATVRELARDVVILQCDHIDAIGRCGDSATTTGGLQRMTSRYHDITLFVTRLLRAAGVDKPTDQQRDAVERILIQLESEILSKFFRELRKSAPSQN